MIRQREGSGKKLYVRSGKSEGKCNLIVLYVYLNITGRLPRVYLSCLSEWRSQTNAGDIMVTPT